MNEETYWIKWVGSTVCTLIVCMASSCSYEQYLDTELAKTGVNPMDIKCAKDAKQEHSICILYLERAKK